MTPHPPPASLELDRLAPEALPGLRILPVVHERIEMTAVVRAVVEALDPAVIAAELPTTLREATRRAVRRLPRVSLLVSQEQGEDALVWVVAPGDPMVEALRWAEERGRAWLCVDPDLPYGERHADPVPDPHALWAMGAESYLELVAAEAAAAPAGPADLAREAGMAYHLRRAAESAGGPVLAVVGAAHAARLAARLREPAAQPLARVRRSSVELRHLDPRDLTALLPDAPLAHAVWEKVRAGELPSRPELGSTLSRRVSLMRFGLRLIAGEGGEEERGRRGRLVDLAACEAARPAPGGRLAPDRCRLAEVVWKVAAGSYREQTGERLQPWQRRLFFEFARRQARLQAQLAPGLYEWLVAARGVGDDNLAWEVFQAARAYPWQEEADDLPVASLDGTFLDLGTRKVRFRRRFFRVKQRPVLLPVRRRPEAEDPAEWLRGFDSTGLCSYPPEDLVIEDYGRFLQRKAVSILSAKNARSEPFTVSLLDGIDLRETLRNVLDGRVWVREEGRVPGEAGSVVVIFDPDPEDRRFPFYMTWLGEHDQESDMAFYSTEPTEQVVGPGIMRATYGGFLLTTPPGRLADVWEDPDYGLARGKADVLVMAAVDYSLEKVVVHVAETPAGERLRSYAAAHGRQILHIPLASLSPLTAKRIRAVHLLAGKDKREIARDYVW